MIRYMHCRDCGTDLLDPLDTLNGFCWDCREDAARGSHAQEQLHINNRPQAADRVEL